VTIDPFAVWSSLLASPQAPKTAMSALELDGYLTGVVVTPQAAPILPSVWMAPLWGDNVPIFDAQINAVLVVAHYNLLIRDIDRSLKRMEADRTIDYRPPFVVGDETPSHDAVRAWASGFWKAMTLAPATWSGLVEDERTKVVLEPFIGFFDLGALHPDERPSDLNDLLDAEAALIPRMILILRKLARIREAAGRSAPTSQPEKVGRNDPCPCGSGKKYKRCCARVIVGYG
jgi:uncharacterized protein